MATPSHWSSLTWRRRTRILRRRESIFLQSSVVAWVLGSAFVAVYVWGGYLGFRLLEGDDTRLDGLSRFWLLQVPTFASPLFSYLLTAGFHLTFLLQLSPPKANVSFNLGSEFRYSLLVSSEPWAVGINVFALLVFLWLLRVRRSLSPNNSLKRTNQSLHD